MFISIRRYRDYALLALSLIVAFYLGMNLDKISAMATAGLIAGASAGTLTVLSYGNMRLSTVVVLSTFFASAMLMLTVASSRWLYIAAVTNTVLLPLKLLAGFYVLVLVVLTVAIVLVTIRFAAGKPTPVDFLLLQDR